MQKYQYSDATTKRYIAWLKERAAAGEYDPPRLQEIAEWLRSDGYARPMDVLPRMCVSLRESGDISQLCWIATQLCYALSQDRQFIDGVRTFFNAMVSRFGVNDFDVQLYDERTGQERGTLAEFVNKKEVGNA